MQPRVEKIVSPTFDQNSYVVHSGPGTRAVVIDPGFNVEELLRQLHYRELTVEAVLLTHGHIDHIVGVGAIKALAPDAPVVIGTRDAAMLGDPELNLSAKYGLPLRGAGRRATSRGRRRTGLRGISLNRVGIARPLARTCGLPLGPTATLCSAATCCSAGGIGRTDFPGGSLPQLLLGIEVKLWPLPPATVVHPGHGPATTLGEERRTNPYLRG